MLGDYREKLKPSMQRYPLVKPKEAFCSLPKKKSEKESEFKKKLLDELDAIASNVKKTGKIPALQKRWDAAQYDCFLFARNDQYK